MNIDIVNRSALEALEKGDFLTAQKLFHKNCNCKDYRTLNNYGVFCIENGFERKNGQIVSGVGYGKRYIKEAYEQRNHADILYNMSACLYETNQFKAVMALLEEHNLMVSDFFLLYLFSALKENKDIFISMLNEKDVRKMKLEPDIILVILYLYDKNKITLEDIDNYLNDWSPDKYMWAVVIDSLIDNHVNISAIKEIIEKKTEGYTSENKLKKSALALLNSSEEQRQIYIESTSYYKPIFRAICGYFGCPIHNTEW